ncbi:MAG: peroxiredoxin family protein, partial [Chthoniobacteraceae bacterium]
AALEPDCAMAYWGMAMANVSNHKRAAEFIKKAVERRDKAGRFEQLWIDAVSDYFAEGKKDQRIRRQELIKALEKISFEFPENIETKAFLVYWLWESKDKGLPITSHQSVDAIAQQVLAKAPMHPVHHYRIHLWNYEDDRRALESAALCGQAAPGIAHMWHMSAHTFTRLKRWADAAWQQEASARVDHAHIAESRILPEQIHNYAHNNDWLVENLQFVGRVRDALDLAKNMIELPRLASRTPLVGKGSGYDGERSGHAMGRNRLMEVALRYELWAELTAVDGTAYLAPANDPLDEARRLRALAVAYYSRQNKAAGDGKVTALEASLKSAREARVAAADEAEAAAKTAKKPQEEVSRAMVQALQRFSRRIDATESLLAEARLYRALAANDPKGAKELLGAAKDIAPERKSRILFQIGDKVAAEAAAREAVAKGEGQVQPLANLADLLWRLDKKADALATFEKLRALSAYIDLGTPTFARLAPIAREANLPPDWRIKAETPADSGVRPELASLGPFRWQPYMAPDWSLSDQFGKQISLQEYRGKPVVVMFYLGSGCTHCIEQLNIFAPAIQKYTDAGISVVAVSTDSADALYKTFAKAKENVGFPFPILADASLETFKAYRAHDDFENLALHGTFLIDGTGHVRWQDISYEPFRDPDWLLEESKRLLALPVTYANPTAAVAPSPATDTPQSVN